MDPLSHLAVTALFVGRKPGLLLAGVAPDLPFYLLYPAWLLRHRRRLDLAHTGWPLPSKPIQDLHHASHSLLMLAGLWAVGRMARVGSGRWALAWAMHILLDVPSHTRARMGPRILWPLSHWAYDGFSWADGIWRLLKGLSGIRGRSHGAAERPENAQMPRLVGT
ncbi:MAG: hypothetical protein JXA74_11620 [Anaerolineae bacterium]|nr:hypothetical protein [Anaerolineae bacterium]